MPIIDPGRIRATNADNARLFVYIYDLSLPPGMPAVFADYLEAEGEHKAVDVDISKGPDGRYHYSWTAQADGRDPGSGAGYVNNDDAPPRVVSVKAQ